MQPTTQAVGRIESKDTKPQTERKKSLRTTFARARAQIFRPSGASSFPTSYPTAYAVGCILSPPRG